MLLSVAIGKRRAVMAEQQAREEGLGLNALKNNFLFHFLNIRNFGKKILMNRNHKKLKLRPFNVTIGKFSNCNGRIDNSCKLGRRN